MDLSILLWIQTHMRNDVLDFIFTNITRLGNVGFIWIVLIAIFLIRKETRYTGVVMLISFILTSILANLCIKPLIDRPRPFQVYPMDLLIPPPSGTSFPSGHTATSFAVAWAYFITRKDKLRFALVLLAVAISFSRLYLFVHFPTDVLAGVVLGILVSYLIKWLAAKFFYDGRWGIRVQL